MYRYTKLHIHTLHVWYYCPIVPEELRLQTLIIEALTATQIIDVLSLCPCFSKCHQFMHENIPYPQMVPARNFPVLWGNPNEQSEKKEREGERERVRVRESDCNII